MRIIKNLKTKVFGDYRKTVKNVEEKRDSEIHNIRSTQNAFYVVSRFGDELATINMNLSLTINYTQEHTRKRRISSNFTDYSTSLSGPVERS